MRLTLVFMALMGLCLWNLAVGSFSITPWGFIETLSGQGTRQQNMILFSLRLPRLVMAALVGAGLALSGAILQGISRNRLADPGILGLHSGAGLAIFAILFAAQAYGLTMPPSFVPIAAFAGAGCAAGLVYLLARRNGTVQAGHLLLAGIAVNAGLSAAMLVMAMRLDQRLYVSAANWAAGSLSGSSWIEVFAILPWIVLALPILAMSARALDILSLGDNAAQGLGVAVHRQKLILIALAVALAGAAVALAGGIGFVGLIAPNIAQRLVGPRHARLLPVAALAGAGLMVFADMLSRTVMAPIELPVGVVVAAIGAPWFIFLLTRQDK